jgi:hypothetical protein
VIKNNQLVEQFEDEDPNIKELRDNWIQNDYDIDENDVLENYFDDQTLVNIEEYEQSAKEFKKELIETWAERKNHYK